MSEKHSFQPAKAAPGIPKGADDRKVSEPNEATMPVLPEENNGEQKHQGPTLMSLVPTVDGPPPASGAKVSTSDPVVPVPNVTSGHAPLVRDGVVNFGGDIRQSTVDTSTATIVQGLLSGPQTHENHDLSRDLLQQHDRAADATPSSDGSEFPSSFASKDGSEFSTFNRTSTVELEESLSRMDRELANTKRELEDSKRMQFLLMRSMDTITKKNDETHDMVSHLVTIASTMNQKSGTKKHGAANVQMPKSSSQTVGRNEATLTQNGTAGKSIKRITIDQIW